MHVIMPIYIAREGSTSQLCVSPYMCEPVCTTCVYTVVIESINLITSPRADALARYTVEREREQRYTSIAAHGSGSK